MHSLQMSDDDDRLAPGSWPVSLVTMTTAPSPTTYSSSSAESSSSAAERLFNVYTDDAPSSFSSSSSSPPAVCLEVHYVFIALLLVLLILLTIFGNVLVVLSVVVYKRMRTFTNILLTSLATADLLVGLIVMPLALLDLLHEHKWPLGRVVCGIWATTDVLLCTASILNLCVISLDRYMAITSPLKYPRTRSKRMATLLLGSVWLLSLIICSPPWFVPSWALFTQRPDALDSSPPHYGTLAHGSESSTAALAVTSNGTVYLDASTQAAQHFQCIYSPSVPYRIYSALGSFYIPLLVMLSVYFKIFRVASEREALMRHSALGTCRLSNRVMLAQKQRQQERQNERELDQEQQQQQQQQQRQRISKSEAPTRPLCASAPASQTRLRSEAARNSAASTLTATGGNPDDTSTRQTVEEDEDEWRAGRRITRTARNTRLESTTIGSPSVDGELLDLGAYLEDGNNGGGGGGGADAGGDADSTEDPSSIVSKQSKQNGATVWAATNGRSMARRQSQSVADLTTDRKSSPTRKNTDIAVASGGGNRHLGATTSRTTGTSQRSAASAATTSVRDQPSFDMGVPLSKSIHGGGRGANKEKMMYLKERKALKTIGIVVLGFCICWLPFFVIYLLEVLADGAASSRTFQLLAELFLWLGYSNSVLNPLIYTMYNGDFRRCFRDLLSLGCVQQHRRTMSVKKLHQHSTLF